MVVPKTVYGTARLFLYHKPEENYERRDWDIADKLASLSIWGGADKTGSAFRSWEFSPESEENPNLAKAKEFLQAQGCQELELEAMNQVWK